MLWHTEDYPYIPFDAMQASGDMMPTAMGTAAMDETDRLSAKSKSRYSSVPAGHREPQVYLETLV